VGGTVCCRGRGREHKRLRRHCGAEGHSSPFPSLVVTGEELRCRGVESQVTALMQVGVPLPDPRAFPGGSPGITTTRRSRSRSVEPAHRRDQSPEPGARPTHQHPFLQDVIFMAFLSAKVHPNAISANKAREALPLPVTAYPSGPIPAETGRRQHHRHRRSREPRSSSTRRTRTRGVWRGYRDGVCGLLARQETVATSNGRTCSAAGQAPVSICDAIRWCESVLVSFAGLGGCCSIRSDWPSVALLGQASTGPLGGVRDVRSAERIVVNCICSATSSWCVTVASTVLRRSRVSLSVNPASTRLCAGFACHVPVRIAELGVRDRSRDRDLWPCWKHGASCGGRSVLRAGSPPTLRC